MKVVKQRAVSENVEKRTFGAVGGNVISTDSGAIKLQPPWKLKNSDTKYVFYSKKYTKCYFCFLSLNFRVRFIQMANGNFYL